MALLNSIILNLIVVIVLIPLNGLTQEINDRKQDKVSLQSTDAYLVKLQIDSVYPDEKFKLRSIFGNQSYKICRIKIKDIYYMGDSSYVNFKGLWNADFMLYKDEVLILQDTIINASLFASSMKNVYFMGRFLSEKELYVAGYNYHAIITHVDIKKKEVI